MATARRARLLRPTLMAAAVLLLLGGWRLYLRGGPELIASNLPNDFSGASTVFNESAYWSVLGNQSLRILSLRLKDGSIHEVARIDRTGSPTAQAVFGETGALCMVAPVPPHFRTMPRPAVRGVHAFTYVDFNTGRASPCRIDSAGAPAPSGPFYVAAGAVYWIRPATNRRVVFRYPGFKPQVEPASELMASPLDASPAYHVGYGPPFTRLGTGTDRIVHSGRVVGWASQSYGHGPVRTDLHFFIAGARPPRERVIRDYAATEAPVEQNGRLYWIHDTAGVAPTAPPGDWIRSAKLDGTELRVVAAIPAGKVAWTNLCRLGGRLYLLYGPAGTVARSLAELNPGKQEPIRVVKTLPPGVSLVVSALDAGHLYFLSSEPRRNPLGWLTGDRNLQYVSRVYRVPLPD